MNVHNPLTQLFKTKPDHLLNIYCTAGYPNLNDIGTIILAAQKAGADIFEVGMPYSDPLADGLTIQNSSKIALDNGMNLSPLFEQLTVFQDKITIPLVLMGYFNPILQHGVEQFLTRCQSIPVSGLIIPDLPLNEFQNEYASLFQQKECCFIPLITPDTPIEKIQLTDRIASGFIYAVTSSSLTGANKERNSYIPYLQKLKALKLTNPLLAGFGIKNSADWETVCQYANGGIIGSEFIKAIHNKSDSELEKTVFDFIADIKKNSPLKETPISHEVS